MEPGLGVVCDLKFVKVERTSLPLFEGYKHTCV